MRWWIVFVYALAMAWVEAAVVVYLRTLVNRLEPYQPNPLPIMGRMSEIELVREAATMVMLAAVGMLGGRTWRSRVGYSAIAFGVWDIFYYVFLKIMCGWPHSVFDWDVLFLIPLPWWGPVLAPVLISVLLILWGTFAGQCERVPASIRPELVASATGFIGMVLGLHTFMADSMAVASQGAEAIRNALPKTFNWPLFCVALLLMAVPVLQRLWFSLSQPRGPAEASLP